MGLFFLCISLFLLWNIMLFSFFIFSIFSNLLNQIYTNVKTSKRKLEGFVQRYSFKFWAQRVLYTIYGHLFWRLRWQKQIQEFKEKKFSFFQMAGVLSLCLGLKPLEIIYFTEPGWIPPPYIPPLVPSV